MNHTTPELLTQHLLAPEGVQLEFKAARNEFHFEKLVDYCVAIGNEGGGKIVLGITDKRPRQVVGTSAFAEPGRTEAGIFDRLRWRVKVEEVQFQNKRVLVIHVPGRLAGTALQHRGRYLRRNGEELVAMSDDDLRVIHSEVAPDFSAQPSGATLGDLSREAIREFARRWARKSNNAKLLELNDVQLLVDAELLVDGTPNFAALVLLGTRNALGKFLGQAELVFEYRSTEASGPAAVRYEWREGFFLWYDALWDAINLRNERQNYQFELFRYDIYTFDESSIREAVLNAIAHRDYRLGGSVFVRQHPRRLEIVSPGGLPTGITTENIIDQQNPRNRRLAEALSKCGLIERSGQGMNLIFENAIRQSKPLPSFAGSAAHEVRLTLEGSVQDAAFLRFLERVGEERTRSFSTHDFLLLDLLRQELPVPHSLQNRLPGLISAGLVESVGRGRGARHLLSRALYAAIGKKGAYTRRRGLDRETNKALLVKHIQDNNVSGSPLAELVQVLPALSEKQVQSLLREMRDAGYLSVRGNRRWARWFFVEPPF